jgi:oligopeptidase B
MNQEDNTQKNNTMNVPQPPFAKIIPKQITAHGHTRTDNYYWLNERENPEVIAYLEAENAYTDSMLAHTKEFQESLFQEIKSRIKEQDESVPYKLGNYFYYARYEVGQEYPIQCRKKGSLEAKEEILLNINELAVGFDYFNIAGITVSTNEQLLAYAQDTVGRRIYTLYFKDIVTGKRLADEITHTTGEVVWANDNKTVFYVTQDTQTLRANKVWRHVLGTPQKNDVLVFEEKDETFYVGIYKSKSKKYIFLSSSSTVSTETHLIAADEPISSPKLFFPRERDHEYSVFHFDDQFYIHTNWKAQNFRLMRCATNNTERQNWQEVIAHRENVLLEGIEIFKNFLVLEERANAAVQIRVIRWADRTEHYLDFGEAAYTAGIAYNPDFNTDILRYTYNSLTTPNSTIDYDMATRTKEVKKQQEVLGDFDKNNYTAERLWATAEDGTKIPISIVYKKGFEKNGQAPLYLTGYGAYGISYDPCFSTVRLSLLNRGFAVAIAHVRGGEDMGRAWYENGKLLHKKNTFTDFIACAKYLIAEKYTSSERLFAKGGSAGGLLMGAVVNLAPELFKGIINDVGFVDVVTTMLDETIPLTTGEFDEWGNPKDSVYYQYILSYSPYDNITAKAYPNMLVTAGLHDSQVQYWEPAKYVAKLRRLKTDNNKLLLYVNMEAGHSGASGRFAPLREIAREYAFIFDLLGIDK